MFYFGGVLIIFWIDILLEMEITNNVEESSNLAMSKTSAKNFSRKQRQLQRKIKFFPLLKLQS